MCWPGNIYVLRATGKPFIKNTIPVCKILNTSSLLTAMENSKCFEIIMPHNYYYSIT